MALILTCYNHPDRPATSACDECDEAICDACTRHYRGETLCPQDYAIAKREAEGEVARAPRRNPPPPAPLTRRPDTSLRQREPAPLRPLPPRAAQRYGNPADDLGQFQYDPRTIAGFGRPTSNMAVALAGLGLLFALLSFGGIFFFSGLSFLMRVLLALAAVPGLIISAMSWFSRYEARNPSAVLLLSVLGAAFNGLLTLMLLLAVCLPFLGLKLLLPFFL